MEIIECINCCQAAIEVDNYRLLDEEDRNYFNNMKIYKCTVCKIAFAYPMPKSQLLNDFYSNVYRKKNRPHYIDYPERIQFREWQNAQYAYMNQFLDFDNIKTVIDVGPGYGFLLREIRGDHPNLKLIAVDPDILSMTYLQKYRIETKDFLFETEGMKRLPNECADLIISSHSLEHMTEPISFFQAARKVLKNNGAIFLEVPNCEFKEDGYLPRPYDVPHLFFFDKESLSQVISNSGFEIVNLTTAGSKMSEAIEAMKKQYVYVRNSIFSRFRAFIPKRFKDLIKIIIKSQAMDTNYASYQYGGNRWTIRAFLRKK